MSDDLWMCVLQRFRFDSVLAKRAGLVRQPEEEIHAFAREHGREAYDLEPIAVADCWLFHSSRIDTTKLPVWIVEVSQDAVEAAYGRPGDASCKDAVEKVFADAWGDEHPNDVARRALVALAEALDQKFDHVRRGTR